MTLMEISHCCLLHSILHAYSILQTQTLPPIVHRYIKYILFTYIVDYHNHFSEYVTNETLHTFLHITVQQSAEEVRKGFLVRERGREGERGRESV